MANISLTDDQMQGLVAGVITSQMTGEQRDKIITDAITVLLTPKKEHYGQTKASPLAECFERAVYAHAGVACKKYLDEHPEVQTQIDSVIADAFKKALVSDRDAVVAKVADAVSTAMYEKGR